MSGSRLVIVLAAVAALAVAFVVLRPGDDDEAAAPATTGTDSEPTTTGTVPTQTTPTATAPLQARIVVTVRDGRPVGGIARATASEGDPVLVVIRSDVADHVHVHGYDLFADVGPGRPARMQFRADLTGRFEIELEDRHELVAQLTVVP